MKRHSALVALSHDHHHALVEARRLRRAAAADNEPSANVAAFRRFFAAVTVPHFREEEETLFPLLVDAEEARPLLVEALLDHQRLHALAATLDGSADVRRTMRELFPLIERLAPSQLDGLNSSDVPHSGPVWGTASEDLNARSSSGAPAAVRRSASTASATYWSSSQTAWRRSRSMGRSASSPPVRR
jgi:Hemerythrin HHE cation binding domain